MQRKQTLLSHTTMGLAHPSISEASESKIQRNIPPYRGILVACRQAKERYGLDIVIVPDDEHGQVSQSRNPWEILGSRV